MTGLARYSPLVLPSTSGQRGGGARPTPTEQNLFSTSYAVLLFLLLVASPPEPCHVGAEDLVEMYRNREWVLQLLPSSKL